MLFSRDDKSDNNTPKKRSLFGQLFNPNVGTEIAPVFESGRMFVRMLAYILAAYKLFPKDHPALENTALKLSLGDVMRTAYSRLSFTRKGIPQIVLFAAVFGCLLFSALFILTLIFSALMGTAHAQTTFTAPHPDTDWALKWIDYLFLGKDVEVGSSLSGQPTGCDIQKAMGTALSIYSSAILVLAGFLLMYHLVFMIAEQAHTGKIMGKANQIWAPIRLVFAIGMLVPITAVGTDKSDCQVTGYNLAQYSAVQVARWGSGLGSRVWETFMDSLAKEQVPVCSGGVETSVSSDSKETKSPSCIAASADIPAIVKTLLAMDACALFFDTYIAPYNSGMKSLGLYMYGATVPGVYDTVFTMNDFHGRFLGITKTAVSIGLADSDSDPYMNFMMSDGGKICGGYVSPRYTSSLYDNVRQVQYDAINNITEDVRSFVNDYGLTATSTSPEVLFGRMQAMINKLRNEINDKVSTELKKADEASQKSVVSALDDPHFTKSGWLMAGSWFTTISKIQSTRSDAVRHALPAFIRPAVFRLAETPRQETGSTAFGMLKTYDRPDLGDVPTKTANALAAFMQAIDMSTAYPYGALSASDSTLTKADANLYETESQRLATMQGNSGNFVNAFFQELDRKLTSYDLWDSAGVIGLNFGMTSNPMQELASFGQSNVELAIDLMAIGAAGSFVSIVFPTVGVFSSFVFALASLIFTIGFTVGYVVPLYPFYRFFFGSLKWVMTVFESIVLAPLFALAHIEPQGEGLAGKRAQYGYNVAMQLLLRPALMVFGLIAGYILFKVGVTFLNSAFVYATKGSSAYDGGTPVVAKIVYTAIYVSIVVILANQCFSTIGLFPQLALRWLGLGQIHEESIGDTGMVTAAATAAASHISSKIPAMAQGSSGAIADKRKRMDADQTLKDQKAAAEEDKLWKAKVLAGQKASNLSNNADPSMPDFSDDGGGGGGDNGGAATASTTPAEPPSSPSGSGGGIVSNYETSPGEQENQYGNMPSTGPAPNAGASKTSPSKLDKAQEEWLAKTDGGKKPPDGWNSGA